MEVQVPDSISLEELLKGLDETVVESHDGYLDADGWAKVWKVPEKQASRAISRLVHAGRMVVRKIQTQSIVGSPYWKPVYGVKYEKDDQAQDDVPIGEVQEGTV